MANHIVSELQDKNGEVYDLAAKQFSGTRTVQMTGDVTADERGWNGSGALVLSTTIADGAVGTAKLADSAVTTGKIADKAVTLDKIADSAKGGAVQDNDGVLATHSQVKNYVDAVVAGEGKYRGIQTVATINTWTAANLNNGDRVITQDAGTITLGNFAVVANQELIFWKDSESQVWQTSEGNYKLKQTAATFTGSTLKTPTSLTQNANGDMSVTFSDIQSASTSQKGVVQLSDAVNSTDTGKAATANAVKKAYDLASNAKPKQTAKSSPTASGSDISFINTITQDANGVITATKKNVRSASASQSGVMSAEHFSKLEGLPANSELQSALSGKADKVANATAGDVAFLDANGNLVDSGKTLGKSVPANAEFTDTKVTQTKDDSGKTAYPLLMAGAPDPNGSAATARYASGVKLTPSTNTISANISGKAASADVATALDMNATVPIRAGTGVSITSSETAVTVALSDAAQTSLGKADSALQDVKIHGEALTKTDNAVDITNAKIFQYGECRTAAATAAKTVTVNGTFTLAAGAVIFVKFANSNTATGATLNVNSTGAKPIYRYGTTSPGTNVPSTWKSGSVVALGYDGTAWQMVGWLNDSYVFDGTYNANTNKAATVSSITSRINALDAEVTSTGGTNVEVKVTETDGKVTEVTITKDHTEKAFEINYRASDQALVFSKAFGTIA